MGNMRALGVCNVCYADSGGFSEARAGGYYGAGVYDMDKCNRMAGCYSIINWNGHHQEKFVEGQK